MKQRWLVVIVGLPALLAVLLACPAWATMLVVCGIAGIEMCIRDRDKPLTLETAEAFSLAVLKDIHARDSWRASKACLLYTSRCV